MKNYPVLRLLLAALMLYFAWPYLLQISGFAELVFWAGWLLLFFLAVGANLANLLQMIQPPIMEQEWNKLKQRYND